MEQKTIYQSEFITATAVGWKPLFQTQKHKEIILERLQMMVKNKDIAVYGYCIMRTHIHIIWQVLGNSNPTEIRKYFFENTAKAFKNELIVNDSKFLEQFKSTQKDRSYHFWKRRPLCIELFTKEVFEQKLLYIHYNPVEAGICQFPEDYEYSSASYYQTGVDKWNILSNPY